MPANTEAYDQDVPTDDKILVPDLDVALFIVLEDVDYEAQLLAIRDLLQRHKNADRLLKDEIGMIDEFARRTTGIINQHAVDEWVEHMQALVYQDAAHSMAAVGMLAPLMESILCQSFKGIRRILCADVIRCSSHPRWQWSAEQQWDCHVFYTKKGRPQINLIEGTSQLAEAVGLSAHLPADFKPTLQALFEYRNKMFHGGFEWANDERQKFHNRIKDWPPEWFKMATHDSRPWIFYMTDAFIAHCLATINTILCGVGAFARDRLPVAQSLAPLNYR
ncbi:MAG TPA: hypothetical protein VKI44_20635 [Acetobacteraceae bacterium]|nr:hypothetical protein [Acetobacteraceae bacterium]